MPNEIPAFAGMTQKNHDNLAIHNLWHRRRSNGIFTDLFDRAFDINGKTAAIGADQFHEVIRNRHSVWRHFVGCCIILAIVVREEGSDEAHRGRIHPDRYHRIGIA